MGKARAGKQELRTDLLAWGTRAGVSEQPAGERDEILVERLNCWSEYCGFTGSLREGRIKPTSSRKRTLAEL